MSPSLHSLQVLEMLLAHCAWRALLVLLESFLHVQTNEPEQPTHGVPHDLKQGHSQPGFLGGGEGQGRLGQNEPHRAQRPRHKNQQKSPNPIIRVSHTDTCFLWVIARKRSYHDSNQFILHRILHTVQMYE